MQEIIQHASPRYFWASLRSQSMDVSEPTMDGFKAFCMDFAHHNVKAEKEEAEKEEAEKEEADETEDSMLHMFDLDL